MADSDQVPTLIKPVMDRFPADADLIRRHARRDSDFLTLCEDYATAFETLRRLEVSNRAMIRSRIAEYRALMRDLEGDIERMLDTRRKR